jgi:hypothetical protein
MGDNLGPEVDVHYCPNHITVPPLTRSTILNFLRAHRYAVEASVSLSGMPQAAVVGIAVSDAFELVFDTLASTRKAQNLAAQPRIAFVIGGLLEGEEQTIQYEGIVDRPAGEDLKAAQDLYFQTFPDGRDRLAWAGLIHLRASPLWLRYSDYRSEPPLILELDGRDLAALA